MGLHVLFELGFELFDKGLASFLFLFQLLHYNFRLTLFLGFASHLGFAFFQHPYLLEGHQRSDAPIHSECGSRGLNEVQHTVTNGAWWWKEHTGLGPLKLQLQPGTTNDIQDRIGHLVKVLGTLPSKVLIEAKKDFLEGGGQLQCMSSL